MIAQDLINKYGLDGSSFQTFLWQDPDVRPRNVPNFKENRIDTVIAGDDESEILTKYIGFLSRNNKTETIKHRLAFQILNVALPALLLLGFAFAFFLLRRRRYARS